MIGMMTFCFVYICAHHSSQHDLVLPIDCDEDRNLGLSTAVMYIRVYVKIPTRAGNVASKFMSNQSKAESRDYRSASGSTKSASEQQQENQGEQWPRCCKSLCPRSTRLVHGLPICRIGSSARKWIRRHASRFRLRAVQKSAEYSTWLQSWSDGS